MVAHTRFNLVFRGHSVVSLFESHKSSHNKASPVDFVNFLSRIREDLYIRYNTTNCNIITTTSKTKLVRSMGLLLKESQSQISVNDLRLRAFGSVSSESPGLHITPKFCRNGPSKEKT